MGFFYCALIRLCDALMVRPVVAGNEDEKPFFSGKWEDLLSSDDDWMPFILFLPSSLLGLNLRIHYGRRHYQEGGVFGHFYRAGGGGRKFAAGDVCDCLICFWHAKLSRRVSFLAGFSCVWGEGAVLPEEKHSVRFHPYLTRRRKTYASPSPQIPA